MQKAHDFTKGPIFRQLIGFTMPVLAALCLQAMYGAVDLAVVGWFGSSADVSAVSTGSQIMQTVTMIVTGLSMGTTVLLGQKLGQKRENEAGKVVGAAVCLFGALALILTVVMLLVAAPFVRLMHAPEEAFTNTVAYVSVCSGGLVFIVAYNLLGSVFRGLGDSKTPLLAVGIACVGNVIGDLLFVAVLGMASAGAALATALSQMVSVVLCLRIIKRRGLPFPFSKKDIGFHWPVIGQTVNIGFPIALQDGLVSVSFLVLLAIVNGLGLIASAGMGVAEKLCAFIMLVPSAFMQALSAFVAQNIGAGENARANRAVGCGMAFSFGLGVVIAWLAFFHGDLLASIFGSGNREVVLAAADYLKAYAIDTLLVSFLFCFLGYFNGCGRTKFVLIQGVVGAFLVRIPVAYLVSKQADVTLFHIGLATPCSTVVQIALCFGYFFWIKKSEAAKTASLQTALKTNPKDKYSKHTTKYMLKRSKG
ncbi:MAG: MATE family efflux transporter [Eubacteriales bacterium]|nr:MATE family efflux transporter [Eubacteriales bacterium]